MSAGLSDWWVMIGLQYVPPNHSLSGSMKEGVSKDEMGESHMMSHAVTSFRCWVVDVPHLMITIFTFVDWQGQNFP